MVGTLLHKIKTREELMKILEPRPRHKPVIMCHGTFDIVHPGHLRHLMYAKEKAPILLASVTADEFIVKGPIRPYVPEELRAANLAALEMVDYVMIDRNPTPVETILTVKPDYFAKGYEYFASGIPARTQGEMQALETYGGEMVFSPGDIVYSSSALLAAHAPKLSLESLLALMGSEKVTFRDLLDTLRGWEGLPVHVVGDTIVDAYTTCALLGPAPKSPTFSVRHERTERFVGAAGIVSRHLRAAGAKVTFSTVLGEDEPGRFVAEELARSGVELVPVIDHTRPTSCKERFLADGYRLLQVDRVDNRPISEKQLPQLEEQLRSTRAKAVIFSDFRHGIFNRSTISQLSGAIPRGVAKMADSQVSNRWGNILEFTDFDLITPNEREARFAMGDQDSVIRPLALELFRRARCKNLILKLGEEGILTYRSPGPMPREFFKLDNFVTHLVDPVGAGDALLAYASLAWTVSQNIFLASVLGSIAAAIECEQQGNIPVTPAQVEERIAWLEKQAKYE